MVPEKQIERLADKELAEDPRAEEWKTDSKVQKLHEIYHRQEQKAWMFWMEGFLAVVHMLVGHPQGYAQQRISFHTHLNGKRQAY